MRTQRLIRVFSITTVLAILVVCLTPTFAFANAGVPMIFLTIPGMTVALLPIISLEASILSRRLDLKYSEACKVSGLANLASTYVGIPVTWAVLLALQLWLPAASDYGIDTPWRKFLAVTTEAPWLTTYEHDLYWMIPAAMLVLLVPFYFASVLCETWVARWMLRSADRAEVKGAIVAANTCSYLFLAFLVGVMFGVERWVARSVVL